MCQVHIKACAGRGPLTAAANSAEQQREGEGGPGGEHDGEAGQGVQGQQHGQDAGHAVQDGGGDHEVAQRHLLRRATQGWTRDWKPNPGNTSRSETSSIDHKETTPAGRHKG